MRRALIIATATALAVLVAATATASSVSLPTLFANQIQKVNAAPHAPAVLLPGSMRFFARHVYPSGGPSGKRYDLQLGAAKNCGGADACFVADFQGTTGGKVFGAKVTVAGASAAGYLKESCGASCSPPQVDFIVHGVLYSIQSDLGKNSKQKLISAAEAAISAGPRS
jgi:hypothetical protein